MAEVDDLNRQGHRLGLAEVGEVAVKFLPQVGEDFKGAPGAGIGSSGDEALGAGLVETELGEIGGEFAVGSREVGRRSFCGGNGGEQTDGDGARGQTEREDADFGCGAGGLSWIPDGH